MRSRLSIAATFACLSAGCLDTKADTPAAAAGAGGLSALDAGTGSVKPAVAPSSGGAWRAQAGSGGAPRPAMLQPTAAASAGAQAGSTARPQHGRAVPLLRAARDAGMPEQLPIPEPDLPEEAPMQPEGSEQTEPTEQPIPKRAGDLIITELMIDPKTLLDAEGEWIELYNATDATLELRDCQLDDGDESLHDIPGALVEPGAYFTIAREPEPGFTADLTVPLSLTNSADSVAIFCQGHEIDRVSYDRAAEFVIKSGVSLALDPEQLDAHSNDAAGAWCEGTHDYATDLGSPGQRNPSCHSEQVPENEHAPEGTGEAEPHLDAGAAEAHDAGSVQTFDAGTPDAHDAGAGHLDAGAPDESY